MLEEFPVPALSEKAPNGLHRRQMCGVLIHAFCQLISGAIANVLASLDPESVFEEHGSRACCGHWLEACLAITERFEATAILDISRVLQGRVCNVRKNSAKCGEVTPAKPFSTPASVVKLKTSLAHALTAAHEPISKRIE